MCIGLLPNDVGASQCARGPRSHLAVEGMRSRLWGIRGAALAVRCRYNSPVDEMLLRSHSPPSWCSSGHASVIANCLTTKSTASARRLKTCSDYTQPDFDMTSGQTPRTECSISSFANVSICYCGSYKLLLSSNKGNQGVQQPPILMASPAPRATQSGKTTPPPILEGFISPKAVQHTSRDRQR